MHNKRSLLVIALAIALAMTLLDCGQAPTGPASGTFGSVYATFKTQCVDCHTPGGSGTQLGSTFDTTSVTTAYNTLLSDTAHNSGGACTSVKLVVPSTPASSYLLAVLFSDYNTNNFANAASCQPITLHHSDLNLSPDEKTSIVAWINGGALNN